MAYIDFQRAFDVISHNKLVYKLISYGISGNSLFWISSFLSNRTQCVRINSTLPPWLPVITVVPQGSVLGPLLFNLYINDLTDNFDTLVHAKMFADDLKLYSEIHLSSHSSTFQLHLDIIQQWSETWQLPISYSKFCVMTVGKISGVSCVFCFDSVIINHVQITRDLGILVEPDLKFKKHISDIINQSNRRSALIFRSFLSLNQNNLLRAYKTYVRPIVEYASPTWSPSLIDQIMAF